MPNPKTLAVLWRTGEKCRLKNQRAGQHISVRRWLRVPGPNVRRRGE